MIFYNIYIFNIPSSIQIERQEKHLQIHFNLLIFFFINKPDHY